MYPELFHIGPFIFRTMNIFWVVAFLWTAFLFWRKGKEEHYPEDQLIDGYLLSFLTGLFVARVGHIILYFNQYNFDILKWINPITYPGGVWWLGLFAACLYLYKFAGEKKWDRFELLDFWFMAVAAGLSIVSIGLFFDGGGAGKPTTLPIGIAFPGVIDNLHPVQLYWAVGYSCLGWYLSWAEYKYRTFRWYRGKKAAQSGFLTSIFVLFIGLCGLVLQPISNASITISGFVIDYYMFAAILIWGAGLLYVRSGRKLLFWGD